MKIPSNKIMRYVRDSRRNKVGMLVGWEDSFGGSIHIGWSLCKFKVGDKFDREVGFRVALDNMNLPMPSSLVDAGKRFRVQCFLCFNKAVDEVFERPVHKMPHVAKVGVPHNSGHLPGCIYKITGDFGCTCRSLSERYSIGGSTFEPSQLQ